MLTFLRVTRCSSPLFIIDCRCPYLIGQYKAIVSCASANHKPELVATLLAYDNRINTTTIRKEASMRSGKKKYCCLSISISWKTNCSSCGHGDLQHSQVKKRFLLLIQLKLNRSTTDLLLLHHYMY